MHDDKWIAHYGVLGMKWGVRKSESSSRVKKSAKNRTKSIKKRIRGGYPTSQDALEAAQIRQKPVRSMSNSELNTLIRRMSLEQQYRNLTDQKINRGKKRVDDMLKYADTANKLVDIYKKIK